LVVTPQGSAFALAFALAFAVAVAVLVVIPQGSDSALALAFLSVIPSGNLLLAFAVAPSTLALSINPFGSRNLARSPLSRSAISPRSVS
jgi:uncharacterized membrane protein YccF (DUF307 family)